ncbi:MAG: twin-arginine translocation signal domain-containing protein, partial [Betaproteobacteria bacterium]|nr:twin-arginine translocation signal domain-containing protein [Betaproteobacteria bacterium]
MRKSMTRSPATCAVAARISESVRRSSAQPRPPEGGTTMTITIDRRQFLKAGAAGTLSVGFSLGLTATPASAATVP